MTRAQSRLTPPKVLTDATNAARKCCLLLPQVTEHIRQTNAIARRQPPLPPQASQVHCDLGTKHCVELNQWIAKLHQAIADIGPFLTPDVPSLVRIRSSQFVSWHHAVEEIGVRLVRAIKWFAGDSSPDFRPIDEKLIRLNWVTLSERLLEAQSKEGDDSIGLADNVAQDAYGLVVQESNAAARRILAVSTSRSRIQGKRNKPSAPKSLETRPKTAITDVEVERLQAKITATGKVVDFKSLSAVRWLKVLAENPGKWISGPDLRLFDPELDGARTDRLRLALPLQLRRLVEISRRYGARLKLA